MAGPVSSPAAPTPNRVTLVVNNQHTMRPFLLRRNAVILTTPITLPDFQFPEQKSPPNSPVEEVKIDIAPSHPSTPISTSVFPGVDEAALAVFTRRQAYMQVKSVYEFNDEEEKCYDLLHQEMKEALKNTFHQVHSELVVDWINTFMQSSQNQREREIIPDHCLKLEQCMEMLHSFKDDLMDFISGRQDLTKDSDEEID